MNITPRIVAVHLLNDRSGSPRVLSQVLRGLFRDGYEVHLYTNRNKDGFLSRLEGVQHHASWYRFRANPWLRLLYYTLSQVFLFFRLLFALHKTDLLYINTVLPFGAALAGKLRGCRIIYHIHESTVSPAILKWFLFRVVRYTASDIINVSKFVAVSHGITAIPNHLIYNAVDGAYLEGILPKTSPDAPSRVLMVCSLKVYKGVFEFLQLAQDHPQYRFRLVLNATEAEIGSFFQKREIPPNLSLYSSQKNLHPFYQWADIILNLSRPDGWVETFGLTIIEGMAYGLPAIVPPVGGILEVIEQDISGFCVDSRDRAQLNESLQKLLGNPSNYRRYAEAAARRWSLFGELEMQEKIKQIVQG